MRKLFTSVAATVLAFGLSAPAHASTVSFTGTLAVALATLPPIAVTATGTADVTGLGTSITALSLSGGTFSTTVTIAITDPAAAPITQVIASVTNGAGSFSTIPGADINNNFATDLTGTGSGTMGIQGASKVGIFAGPLVNLTVPFTSGGNGVGLGGNIVTATSPVGIGVSVRGAPWTTGTATVGTATAMGFVTGNSIQLVSPTFISITGAGTGVAVLPAFGVLTLSFVPEPGTLLLLASGVAGLAVLGRKRMSK
jgi:hypothetical protein